MIGIERSFEDLRKFNLTGHYSTILFGGDLFRHGWLMLFRNLHL